MEHEHNCQAGTNTDNGCLGTGEDQSDNHHSQKASSDIGIAHSISPGVPCPETVLVVLMSNGNYLLVGYPQGEPAAFVTAEEAGSLRQVLTAAFEPGHLIDEGAIGNGTSENIGAVPAGSEPHEHRAWPDMTREDREPLMHPGTRSEQPRAARLLRKPLPQTAGPAMPGRPKRYEPVAGLVFHSKQYGGSTMRGKHRLKGRSVVQRTTRHRAIEVVDARTLTAHFLSVDALAAGRLPKGRYIARCGEEVLPASLTEPGRSRCLSCVPIPSQRSRSS